MKLRTIGISLLAASIGGRVFAGCQPTNLINNCGFPANILGWTVTSGAPTHNAGGGNSTPGSLQVVGASVDIAFEQCVDVTSLVRPILVNYGVDFRDSSSNAIETVTVSVADYFDTACTSGNDTGNSSNASDGTTSTSYEQVGGSHTVGATAQGVMFRVYALRFSPTITANFDDAFFGSNVVPVELQRFEAE